MCGPQPDHAPAGYEPSPAQEFEQYVDSIMEGLTAQSVIPVPAEVAFDPDADDAAGPEELLRAHIMARSRWGLSQGLVIQSEQPAVCPHIVITPPMYSTFECYCPCGHCSYDTPSLPPQSVDHLMVPPRRDEGIVKAAYPWRQDQSHPIVHPPDISPESFNKSDLFGQPRRVFSPSLFHHTVDKAAQERLVFYHVIPMIQRWCYRLAAMHASAVAASFRTRWDSELFCRQIERPFKWTDPGEPLLASYIHEPNTLILDSVDPFVAPHVVIHEAPELDLRTLDGIYISPQCCYGGRFLTHPSGCTAACCFHRLYAAPPVLELELPAPELAPLNALDAAVEIEGIEFVDEADSSSDSSSDSSDSGSDADADSDASSDTLVTPTHAAAFAAPGALPLLKDTPPPVLDEDDEDGLPPFDDWYQAIARRAVPA